MCTRLQTPFTGVEVLGPDVSDSAVSLQLQRVVAVAEDVRMSSGEVKTHHVTDCSQVILFIAIFYFF